MDCLLFVDYSKLGLLVCLAAYAAYIVKFTGDGLAVYFSLHGDESRRYETMITDLRAASSSFSMPIWIFWKHVSNGFSKAMAFVFSSSDEASFNLASFVIAFFGALPCERG